MNPYPGTIISIPQFDGGDPDHLPYSTMGGYGVNWSLEPWTISGGWAMEGNILNVKDPYIPSDTVSFTADMLIYSHAIDGAWTQTLSLFTAILTCKCCTMGTETQ